MIYPYGKEFKRGVTVSDATIYDVAPTVLRVCGFPPALDDAMKSRFYRMLLESDEDTCPLVEGVAIRSYLKERHHEAICSVYGRSFSEPPWESDWDRFEQFDPDGVFVAEESKGKTPVGYVISFRRPGYGYVSVVAVLPEYRRRGIAFTLVRTAIRYLRQLGVRTIMVDAPADSPPAVHLYEKVGFRVVGTYEDEQVRHGA